MKFPASIADTVIYRQCRAFLFCVAFAVSFHVYGQVPSITNIRAEQDPGTKNVILLYDALSGENEAFRASVAVKVAGIEIPATSFSGPGYGNNVQPGFNRKIIWDAGSDWNGQVSNQVVFSITTSAPLPPAPEGFALIPAGTFIMGSPADELGRDSDETQHQVTLTRDFFMQRTEVTWAQWNEVRNWALDHGYTDLSIGRKGSHGDERNSDQDPVTYVSWYDAVKWLNAWSEKEGLQTVYRVNGDIYRTGGSAPTIDLSANGYRLPTEAEWEYAARAGTTTAFFTGAITYTGSSPVDPSLDLAGWYSGNSDTGDGKKTQPVGQKQANAWGLYDMHGNVWEWCSDRYSSTYPGTVTDPTGPSSGAYRVLRGGSGNNRAGSCRSADRGWSGPDDRSSSYGFRPARSSVP
jgi:formylglycine-generating enzyme required for sulfatase activity